MTMEMKQKIAARDCHEPTCRCTVRLDLGIGGDMCSALAEMIPDFIAIVKRPSLEPDD
jgi:hypothetical protein